MSPTRATRIFLLVVCTVSIVSCGGEKVDGGAATPRAALEAADPVGAPGEFVTLVDPDQRPVVSTMLLFMSRIHVKQDAASLAGLASRAGWAIEAEDFERVLNEHGLQAGRWVRAHAWTKEAAVQVARRLRELDHAAFAEDLSAIMPQKLREQSLGRWPHLKANESLTDIEVTGNTARATAGGRTVRFVRRGGKWFLRLTAR